MPQPDTNHDPAYVRLLSNNAQLGDGCPWAVVDFRKWSDPNITPFGWGFQADVLRGSNLLEGGFDRRPAEVFHVV